MGAARTKTGSLFVLALSAALVLPVTPGVGWADPPPVGSACTIEGTAGPEVLTGTGESDVICGKGGDDTIKGLGGDDLIMGGPGNDTVDGGSGADDLRGETGDDILTGGTGEDDVFGGGGEDDVSGGTGHDTVSGGAGIDMVRGNDGDDVLRGRRGEDRIFGGDGNDVLHGGSANDDLYGQADDDVLVGGVGDDAVFGDAGVDNVSGAAGNDKVVGGEGIDLVRGNVGDDEVRGGDGDDVLRGGPGNDQHFGEVGDDTIYDRDGIGNVDDVHCGDGTDVARVDVYDTVNADCEQRENLDREDPVAVDDAETVDEDDAATTVDVLANDTDLDGGPIEIASVIQPVKGTVVITNGGADLTYEPVADYCNDGTPTDDFTYTLAPGGDTATVAMTVTCVADVPVAEDDTETVAEDDPPTTIDVLANDDADGQVITITGVIQPTNGSVVITNAGADLTYEPVADYCYDGTLTDDFTYTITGGDTATVAVTVTCVNDTPTAVADIFDAIGNTGLFVGTTRPSTQAGKEIAGSILANDTDTDTPQASLVAEPVTDAPTTLGGSITIQSDGNFTYHPGDADVGVTDTFTYRVCDSSPCNAGTDANSTGTVSLPLTGQVWYVRNNEPAGGDGTSDTPFDTIAEAEAASGTGDTVFVFDGSNTTINLDTGFAMDVNERLIGESRPLSLDPDGGGPLGTSSLHPGTGGAQPTLTANNEDVVVLASNVLVDGVDLDPSGTGGGISGGAGVGAVTVQNVNVTDTGTFGTQPGIELDGTTGVNRFTGVTVTNGGSATAIGVRINNADQVLFANTATNTIATTGAKALDAASTNLLTSRWNDITVTDSGTGAVRLSSTTGQPVLGDGVGTDLSLSTTSGATAALDIASSNTVTVDSAGTDTVSATGGPALDIRNSNGSQFFFDSASSTNSAGDGIDLSTNLTSPVVINAGTISGAAGIAVDINGGGVVGGDVTFAGAINDGPGQSVEVTGRDGGVVTFSGNIADSGDAGGGIVVSSNSAGSTTFSGAAKVLNTGASNAVSMVASDGHTLSFTGGGLDIDTTGGRGFNADASGTVSVTGSGNTIDSTTGRALSVVSTDIAAADLTFQRISAIGGGSGSQGIVLDGTGASGNLVVTGNGGICTIADTSGCSGGTISGFVGVDDASTLPVGTGIVLRNTTAPSFTRIHINGGGGSENYGIRGTAVNGFIMADSVLDGTIGTTAMTANKDGALRFEELAGTVNVTNTAVSGGYFTNIMVDNTTGVLNATFDNVDSLALDDTGGDDAVQFEGIGTADMNVTYTNSQITDASGDLLQYIGDGTGGGDLDLTNNAFTNNEPSINTGGGGIALVAGANGAATMDVLNNTMRDSKTNMLTIIKSLDVAAGTNNLVATIDNNDIGVAGVANSGSAEGDGMEITSFGDGNATFTVTNNEIHQYNSSGIQFVAGGGGVESGQFNLAISGNTVANPGTNPLITLFNGIRVDSGVAVGDTFATCVDFGANTIAGSGNPDFTERDFRLVASQSTTVRQPGYVGGNTDGVAFATYAESLIGGGAQGTAVANAPAVFAGGPGTTCP